MRISHHLHGSRQRNRTYYFRTKDGRILEVMAKGKRMALAKVLMRENLKREDITAQSPYRYRL